MVFVVSMGWEWGLQSNELGGLSKECISVSYEGDFGHGNNLLDKIKLTPRAIHENYVTM